MTSKELIKEAAVRYPIGTEFKSMYNHGVIRYVDSHERITSEAKGQCCIDGNYVYRNYEWAEIIYSKSKFNYYFY